MKFERFRRKIDIAAAAHLDRGIDERKIIGVQHALIDDKAGAHTAEWRAGAVADRGAERIEGHDGLHHA